MPDPVSRVNQAGAMMTGDAVEEDGLPIRVGQQVGRLGHLLDCRRRAPHRHEHPVDADPIDDA